MNKFSRYLQQYLIYGFVPVVAQMLWAHFFTYDAATSNVIVTLVYNLLCYNLMFWFAAINVFMFTLVISSVARENALRRLANIKESDEREEYITGKAARASYIATLSLTLFFLFTSMFSVNFSTLTQTDPSKPGHSVGIGFGYRALTESNAKLVTGNMTPIFDSTNYALSSSTLLLILLGWQLFIFNVSAKRLSE